MIMSIIKNLEKNLDLLEKDPDNCDLLFLIAEQLIDTGEYQVAIDYLMRVLEIRKQDIKAYENIADSYFQLGNYQKAAKYYQLLNNLLVTG